MKKPRANANGALSKFLIPICSFFGFQKPFHNGNSSSVEKYPSFKSLTWQATFIFDAKILISLKGMEINENLISYHFQRKLAGVPAQEIEESLRQNILDEEERQLVLNLILKQEKSFRLREKIQRKKRRLFLISCLAMPLITFSYIAYHWQAINFTPWWLLFFIAVPMTSATLLYFKLRRS